MSSRVIDQAVLAATADLPRQVQADRVVGLGTLCQRYGLDRPTMLAAIRGHGAHLSVINVEAVRGRPRSYGQYLVAHMHHNPVSSYHTSLAHYAGAAAIRLLLGAAPPDWRHAGTGGDQEAKPDAYWHQPGGREWAIEYDRGTYAPRKIEQKLRTNIELSRPVVWGAPVDRRLLAVGRLAAKLDAEIAAERRRHGLYVGSPVQVRLLMTYWHVGSEA